MRFTDTITVPQFLSKHFAYRTRTYTSPFTINVTQEGPLRFTADKRRSLKRMENWLKFFLLGIQTGDKLAKPPFFVALSQFGRGRLSLVAISFYALLLLFGSCRLSEFTLVGPRIQHNINRTTGKYWSVLSFHLNGHTHPQTRKP